MTTFQDDDIEMSVRFKVHCPRCGNRWSIESVILYPVKEQFAHYVRQMRRSLDENERKCCGKKLPSIGKQWEQMWP